MGDCKKQRRHKNPEVSTVWFIFQLMRNYVKYCVLTMMKRTAVLRMCTHTPIIIRLL